MAQHQQVSDYSRAMKSFTESVVAPDEDEEEEVIIESRAENPLKIFIINNKK